MPTVWAKIVDEGHYQSSLNPKASDVFFCQSILDGNGNDPMLPTWKSHSRTQSLIDERGENIMQNVKYAVNKRSYERSCGSRFSEGNPFLLIKAHKPENSSRLTQLCAELQEGKDAVWSAAPISETGRTQRQIQPNQQHLGPIPFRPFEQSRAGHVRWENCEEGRFVLILFLRHIIMLY